MAPKKKKPAAPATTQGAVDLANEPARLRTRATGRTAAHAPELSRDTRATTTKVSSAAAASAPDNRKRGRNDKEEDDPETSSAPKRARKDGRASNQEKEQGKPQVPVDVQSYIAKRTQAIRAEVQKLGKSVMPPPPAVRRIWETDSREKAEVIAKLVFKAKCLSLITKVNQNEERQFLTPREIDAWAKSMYDGLSKKDQEEIAWIKVEYTHNPPPKAKNLHRALPEGEDAEKVDWPEEFAWTAWEAKKDYKIQPSTVKTTHWNFFELPGEGIQPYNRQLIAKAKEEQIVQWMKKNNQPFSWDKIRKYGPTPSGAGKQPKTLNTWNDFHGWTAKGWSRGHRDEGYAKWSVLDDETKRFEMWKRLRTVDQFLEVRNDLGRRYRDGNEEAKAEARALLDSMPNLEYIPRQATSEKGSEKFSDAIPARRSTRTTRSDAMLPSGAWKWPKEDSHPDIPGVDAE
ncbi:tRNA(His) guanylyltransferase [Venturia inaequalis]|nr:tRNA(His) guanylyltransferase [Venturia inaequalis]